MPLPSLPVHALDDENHKRRARETINNILNHKFDDSKVRTSAEVSAGVTPVNYSWPPGDVRRYGATGDGVTDDTVAIQAAMSVHQPVYIPGTNFEYIISNVLDCSYIGQVIYGDGRRSLVRQTSSVAGKMAVFRTIGFPRCRFIDLYAKPYSTGDFGALGIGTIQAFGFDIENADECEVRNCFVSDHRRGGILVYNSSHCKIINNVIIDSVVNPATDTQSDTGADIYISGAISRRNLIKGNHCINGAGIGIAIQTLVLNDSCDFNVIEGNIVKDQDLYGIMLYTLHSADTVSHTLISGNLIDTVTGDIPEDGGLYNYGAGIYVQTSEHTQIVSNHIYNTVTRPNPDLNNSPSAIGVTGAHNVLIANNFIEEANYWGIQVNQATAYTASGRGAEVIGNKLRNCDNTGIYLLDITNGVAIGNRVHTATAAGNGIFVRQVAQNQSNDFTIADNTVMDFGVGIMSEGIVHRMVVHDNVIRGNTSFGIRCVGVYTDCHNNTVENGVGGDGISLASTCVDGSCVENTIIGGDYGVLDDNGGTLRTCDNVIQGATTPYSTSIYTTLGNTTTPAARNKKFWLRNTTTGITDLTNGFVGQIVVIKATASFTITHGSGISLSGAVNFAMTADDTLTLLREDAGWRELSRAVI